MAFDQPLKADQVDGSGFFSVFVGKPVVGTLLWILGGDDDDDDDDDIMNAGDKEHKVDAAKSVEPTLDDNVCKERDIGVGNNGGRDQSASGLYNADGTPAVGKQSPAFNGMPTRSSIAASSLEPPVRRRRRHKRDTLKSRPHMIGSDLSEIGELLDAADDSAFDDYHRLKPNQCLPRNKKTMSWSDESGQDLVRYLDEVRCISGPSHGRQSSGLG